MERQVHAVVFLCVASACGLFHGVHHGAQLLRLSGGHALCQFAAHVLIHDSAQFKDLQSFFNRDIAHEHAAVLFGAHQAGFFQHAKSLAHRSARHAQSIRDGGLCELGTGAQLAVQNEALYLGLHQTGE
ncbi:hypothetical protein D3C71_1757510 [compost metagenome]